MNGRKRTFLNRLQGIHQQVEAEPIVETDCIFLVKFWPLTVIAFIANRWNQRQTIRTAAKGTTTAFSRKSPFPWVCLGLFHGNQLH